MLANQDLSQSMEGVTCINVHAALPYARWVYYGIKILEYVAAA